MAAKPIEERVQSLLSRRLAQAKMQGTPVPDIEAAALFETIALTLLLHPKSVLYIEKMARDGLIHVVRDALTSVDRLASAIEDLANTSFAIKDTSSLSKARLALLQMEGLDKVSVQSAAYRRFNAAVDEFLTRELGPSVRRAGKADLLRPSAEAEKDLPEELSTLKSLHADLLRRLYALDTGADNFLSAPIGTLLGLSAASRAREEIEAVLDEVSSDESASGARDYVLRLMAARASLKTMGTLPSLTSPLVGDGYPQGHTLTASTEEVAPSVLSVPGPWVLPLGASFEAGVPGTGLETVYLPLPDANLDVRALILGEEVSKPIVIPPGYDLYLNLDDVPYRIPLNETAGILELTVGDVAAAIESVLDPQGGALELHIDDEESRLAVWSGTSTLSVSPLHQEVVAGGLITYQKSAHSLLGLSIGQAGRAYEALPEIVAFGLNRGLGHVLTASVEEGRLRITLNDASVGNTMRLTAPPSMGLSGDWKAESDTVRLRGIALGKPVDPFNPVGLVSVGDTVTTPTGASTVMAVTPTHIVISPPLSTFEGDVQVTSALVPFHTSMQREIGAFLEKWLASPYHTTLSSLERALTPLFASPTPSRRATALGEVASLRSLLEELIAALSAPSLLPGAGSVEGRIVAGIESSLTERGYDRALDMLYRMELQEMLETRGEEASYGGAFLTAVSDFVQKDVSFPNHSLDEGEDAKAFQRRGT